MSLIVIALSFAAGWLLAGDRPSPPPPACPPVEYPMPPAELMAPPPLDYLIPPEQRRTPKGSGSATPNATG